jgi:ABC-type cobalamin/Fe3+-siderophores transport system ATPase subunit
MITSLHIDDPESTPCQWWPKVAAFAGVKQFDFDERLTVVWGPNGCGKSTLLRVLARLTHCEQAGVPTVTQDSLSALSKRLGARLESDGRPVHYFDPNMRAGLVGGMAGFDYDFTDLAFQTMARDRVSSGQGSTAEFNRILQSAATTQTVTVKAKHRADAEPALTQALRPTPGIVRGLPTLLLDEPERSLSLTKAAELWHALSQQKRFQVIVATHSISALGLDAHYLDVQPGYLAEASTEVHAVSGRLFLQARKVSK